MWLLSNVCLLVDTWRICIRSTCLGFHQSRNTILVGQMTIGHEVPYCHCSSVGCMLFQRQTLYAGGRWCLEVLFSFLLHCKTVIFCNVISSECVFDIVFCVMTSSLLAEFWSVWRERAVFWYWNCGVHNEYVFVQRIFYREWALEVITPDFLVYIRSSCEVLRY